MIKKRFHVFKNLSGWEDPQNMRALATLCWRGLLLLALTLGIMAFVFGVWKLRASHKALDGLSQPQTSQAPTLNRKDLDAVVNRFIEREKAYIQFKTGTSTVRDPSH